LLPWSCRAGREKKEQKTASRAERASHWPRREEVHALGLNELLKTRNRVLDNNIEKKRATVFPTGETHSTTRTDASVIHQYAARGRQIR
jgi:hypothetical protein